MKGMGIKVMQGKNSALTPDGRRYKIGDMYYVRVSEALSIIPKPQLDAWRKRIGEEEAKRISEETANIGDAIHEITSCWDLGDEDRVNMMVKEEPWLKAHLNAWIKWVDTYVKEWVEIERTIWSDSMGIAGTMDRLGVMKGEKKLTVFDIKTGKQVGDGLKENGYKLIWNEMVKKGMVEGGKRAENVKLVHMPRNNPGNLRVWDRTSKLKEEEFKMTVKMWNEMIN